MKKLKLLCMAFVMATGIFGCTPSEDKAEIELSREAVSDYIREITLKYDDTTAFDSSNYTEQELEKEKEVYGDFVDEQFLRHERMGIAILQETADHFGITLEELLQFMVDETLDESDNLQISTTGHYFDRRTADSPYEYHRFIEDDGDVCFSFIVENTKDFFVESFSNSNIIWVITSDEKDKEKEEISEKLADTIDGVVVDGITKPGEGSLISLLAGDYKFYAYCEDGSEINIRTNAEENDDGLFYLK